MDSYSVAEAALGVCLRIHPKGRVVTRVKSIGALALMLFPLLGCSSPAGPSEDSPRIDPSWIVDSLRDGVSADGLFRLADVREFPDEATRQEGGALAVAIVKFLGSTTGAIREYVETTHGAAIEFDKLFPCGRIVYVVSPFNPVKSETASAIRNVTGGAWVQPMCLTLAGPPVMLQYVAARARVRVVGGVIGGGPLVGNEFYSVGVPKAAPTRFVQTPERAAQRVFMRTNTRIAKVPDLLHDQYYSGPTVVNGRPLGFLWIFTLERPRSSL